MANDPTTEDRLYSDPAIVEFYDIENEGGADAAYCLAFAEGARSVLDLGCGTGQLAAAMAKGRSVTGVDPAAAMLDVARDRPGGAAAEWIEDDARSVRLGRTFDLVLLTGHAFQVFLTSPDRFAVLRTIACHLAPGGRFIFDTRNPAAREWLEWTPELSLRSLVHPRLGAFNAWNEAEHDADTGIVAYRTFYKPVSGGASFTAESRIAFPAKEELGRSIEEAGLAVGEWLGDWSGTRYEPLSPEIIPIGRLR